MAYQYFQPNPKGNAVGDCVIRALCKAFGNDWYTMYTEVVIQGYALCDMPSSNAVWGQLLKDKGYTRYIIPSSCPGCYTICDFSEEHSEGTYIVCTGTHTVTIRDGCIFDSWDSSSESPVFYFRRDE